MNCGGRTTREYGIRIGAVTFAVRMAPRRYETLLAGYFRRPSAHGSPDFRLAVRVTRGGIREPLPDSLYDEKEISPAGFTLAGGLVRGRRLAGNGGVRLRVPSPLVSGHAIRLFEHLLHQAFSTAARARGEDCFLVHSSGVVRHGGGFLFVGASGAGKSTIAQLSSAEQVLNDEICMVSLADSPPGLYSTPFNGFFEAKIDGHAPLRAVFLLAQAKEHRVLRVSRSEAVSAIFQQVVPPVALDEPLGKPAFERMLDCAGRLSTCVPVFRLEFRKDAAFWPQIDRTMLEGGLP